MSRGNDGQEIFLSSSDRHLFLNTLSEVCEQTGWQIHAYALMNNHYHLLLETPEANLVSGMKWFQGTYTQRFNRRHNKTGHLYQGRYKALPVAVEEASYFRVIGTYIHLNPVRSRAVSDERKLAKDDLLSSYPHYVDGSSRPTWLKVERLLSCCQAGMDNVAGRKVYRCYMKNRITEVLGGKNIPDSDLLQGKGWVHGSEEFRKKLASFLAGGEHLPVNSLHGEQRTDHGTERAEYLLSAALLALDISEPDLLQRKAVDLNKQAVAWLLHQNTTTTVSWIAKRLKMGHRVNASRAIKAFCEAENEGRSILKHKMLQCLG
jgi:REP element-mobilizing transposase RayT